MESSREFSSDLGDIMTMIIVGCTRGKWRSEEEVESR